MLRSVLLATAASAALASPAMAQTAPRADQPAATPQRPPRQAAQPAETAVEGVTVSGRRADFTSGIDRRSYSVANDLQAVGGSIADALRNVPSVEVDVQGNVSLRGDPNVTILIDGRPSGAFTGESQADALQALSADQIDRVEVITNPSAAMRPDGTGGVINLVTKRNRRPGRYATVRGQIGAEGRGNLGASGAYASEKLTLSGDAGYRRTGAEGTARIERARLVSGQFVESRQDGVNETDGQVATARVRAEYNLDALTNVSAEFRRFDFGVDGRGEERFEGEDATGAVVRAFTRRSETDLDRSNTEGSLGFRRTFSGTEHELTANFSVERSESARASRGVSTGTGLMSQEGFDDIRNRTEQAEIEFRTEYDRPLPGDSRLRLGYEWERQDISFDNFGRRGSSEATAVSLPSLTNLFAYEQDVQSAYATYERPFGKLRAQAGLRLEQVNIDLNSVTDARAAENDYSRAYPTLHLGYALSENDQLTASYSRRVQRPRPEDLNPFEIFIDPFNRRAGNPDLEPTETDSYELGYQRRQGQTYYLATLFYRHTENGVTDVVRDLGGGVLLTTRENLAERRAAGLELVANGRITPKLTYNISGNLLHEEIAPTPLSTGELSSGREGASVGGRFNLNWQPTDRDFLQLNAAVMGRRLQAQGYREPSGVLNLGYRRKVNERLSLLLTAQNVLDSFRDVTVIDTPTLRDRIERTGGGGGGGRGGGGFGGGRTVFVGFTYTFTEGARRQQREPGFEFDEPGDAPQ